MGYNKTISTFLNSYAKTCEYIKISQALSVIQSYIDTNYICVNNIISLSDSLCIQNIPIYYNKNTKSNLIGVGFFKEFGEVIFMNSSSQILLRQKEYSIFVLDTYVIQNNKIVSVTIKSNNEQNIPSLLNHELSDSITFKKITLPHTLYKRASNCSN